MSVKSALTILPLAAVILYSCGASKEATKKLESANAQIQSLQQENAQLSSSVTDLKKQVSDLSAQNNNINTQFASYKKQCDEQAQQLKAVSAVLDEFHQNVAKLIERLQEAEAKFANKGLEVYSEDGVVFVNMQDNLLYKSGSAALSPQGKEALSNLASVLNEFPKLKVIVVGNTDTVHVKGVADNWSLSTERANGVVRVLSKDYSVDPGRLTSAGRSKFHPIGDNSTAEGRAKNRRTEIVLNPDWERIWETVKTQ